MGGGLDRRPRPVSASTGGGTSLTTTLEYKDTDNPFGPSKLVRPQGTVVNYGYDTAGRLDCMNTDDTSGATCDNDGTGSPPSGQWHTDHNADGTVDRVIDAKGTPPPSATTASPAGPR